MPPIVLLLIALLELKQLIDQTCSSYMVDIVGIVSQSYRSLNWARPAGYTHASRHGITRVNVSFQWNTRDTPTLPVLLIRPPFHSITSRMLLVVVIIALLYDLVDMMGVHFIPR